MNAKVPSKGSGTSNVDAFLKNVAKTPQVNIASGRGRLLFTMDATASRQPTWDRAANIQAEMFTATSALGGLDVQLAFFRGFGEFKVSQWTNDGVDLLRMMTSVTCFAGETQIGKVLKHALNESHIKKINAVVYVGDSMEENIDALGKTAGELGLNGVPVFMFQEGADPIASYAFQDIARLSGGACVRFDANSADALKKLLSAVAVYAAGGRRALNDLAKREGGAILKLTHQLGKN